MRRPRGVELAPGAVVGRGVVWALGPGARIVVGPGAVIEERCELRAGPGAVILLDGRLGERSRIVAHERVEVGAGAVLGPECALVDVEPIADDPEVPLRLQGLRTSPVLVEAGAVLGPRVALTPGARIGAGATVLAHSVVGGVVPPGGRAEGAPARAV